MPSIARPTKGATCSCDDADPTSRGPRRAPRRQLPPVPSPRRELSRRRTRGRPAASVRTRGRPAQRVALGVLVRLRDPGRRALLAGRGAVALHAAVGARLSRDDRALRRVACAALLVGRPRASPSAPHAAVLVQWADLAGARGVTLWLAWCSVMLVEAMVGNREQGAGSRTLRWRPVVAVLATVLCAWAYGAWRARTLPIRELGTVGLIQPNEGFREKWDPRHADSVVAKLVTMSRGLEARGRVALMVWPEVAIPGYLQPAWDSSFAGLARESRTPILAGGIYGENHPDGSYDYFNAAFYFDSSGNWRRYPVYEKHYLVPVVERVPFVPARLMQSVPGVGRWSGGFGRGRSLPVYSNTLGRFGVMICYESAFEDLARGYRRSGAEFLVNITNDAWYGRTAGPYQHAAHLVMRAIETRMGIARAANDGISEFLDPLGHTYAETGLEQEAMVADRLRTSDVIPLYVRLGDWVGTLCVLATLGLAVWLAVDRWKSGHST